MYLIDIKFDLVERLGLNREKLVMFLRAVERGYDDVNPYHNNTHAADVTLRFATLIYKCGLDSVFGDLELLTGLLAAILHDMEHPGTNNHYEVYIQSEIAVHFNDQHVLENHSLHVGLSLLEPGKDTNFLEDSLSKTKQQTLRSVLISMVLATDMSEHFNIMSAFKAKVISHKERPAPPQGVLELFSEDERGLILKMGLKCSDIGHVTLPVEHHIDWVRSLQEEFYMQGDKESEQRKPISFLCDRSKPRNGPAHGENQLGFLDVICEPMYSAWVKIFPICQELLENLQANRRYWEHDVKIEVEVTDEV
mmetsp:Transcript_2758/g.3748  ORF Transcript_2758/g.3748 Transcript_2758/m.3748 type:complete len:308 (+) Transcript_2758:441-1364(+)